MQHRSRADVPSQPRRPRPRPRLLGRARRRRGPGARAAPATHRRPGRRRRPGHGPEIGDRRGRSASPRPSAGAIGRDTPARAAVAVAAAALVGTVVYVGLSATPRRAPRRRPGPQTPTRDPRRRVMMVSPQASERASRPSVAPRRGTVLRQRRHHGRPHRDRQRFDLPQDVCDELAIEVVPLTIRFGDTEYVDRSELTTDEFWRKLHKSSVLPETAAVSGCVRGDVPPPRRLQEQTASSVSTCPRSCRRRCSPHRFAAKALDGLCPIAIVDSKSASMGIGNLVLHAADRAAAGADLDTIVREVEQRRTSARPRHARHPGIPPKRRAHRRRPRASAPCCRSSR